MSSRYRSDRRVVMIALDAAEPRLIERWIDEGRLPHLRRLREAGGYSRLGSSADWLAGSPWPTFHSGTDPGEHGLYHFVQWDAERMTSARPSRFSLSPFWRNAGRQGCRVVALDPPLADTPEPFNGVEIAGWCNHDLLGAPASHPPEMLGRARRRFGVPALRGEVYGLEPAANLLRLRDDLVRWTQRTVDFAIHLMEQEAWDLFMVCLTATHRGGHKLWDASATCGDLPEGFTEDLSSALLRVYAACDESVGRLVATAGPASVLVFSLHGMGPNTSRVPLLPRMLDRVLGGGKDPRDPDGTLRRLRDFVPIEWRNAVKNRLPSMLQDRLTVFWRLGGVDMSSTQAVPLVADLQGYIRINLKGREARGIVEPGEEYDRLCEKIARGLESFADADTGAPVVEEIMRSDRLFPRGRRLDELPDLIVRWSSVQACEHRTLVSPVYGSLDWPTPGKHPEGRSGNHRDEGFLLAHGPGVRPGSTFEGAHVVDLAPTVCSLLGLPSRPEWTGKILSEIFGS